MKKTILSALVVLASSTALAGSIKNSAEGVSAISAGLSGASLTTLRIVADSASGSVAMAADSIADTASAIGRASLFVIENPSEASNRSLQASQGASVWALTTSGQLIKLTIDSAVEFVKDPVGSTSASIQASGEMIKVVIDASGQVASASGAYLKDQYGDDMALVMTGSGQIYTVSAGSVVASINGSKAVLQFVGDTVVDASVVASSELKASLANSVAASSNVFNASTKSGKQYKK